MTMLEDVGGAVVFIGWVITGILYLTASGKPEKMNVAKIALIACTIGTLLIILAAASGPIMNIIANALGVTAPNGGLSSCP